MQSKPKASAVGGCHAHCWGDF